MKNLSILNTARRLAFGAIATTALTITAVASNGGVIVQTNEAAGNKVVVYTRASTGVLTQLQSLPTGGLGTGAGLGSQGSVSLSGDGKWAFVVDAGSNDFAVFAVKPWGLMETSRVNSDGVNPISVTSHGNLVYVLNTGGTANIAGFQLDANGVLKHIPNSGRYLANGAASGPVQIQFDHEGDVIVVAEKLANKFEIYSVADSGQTFDHQVQSSAGQTPFGFAFGKRDQLFDSEAFGGAANASALSSYNTWNDGSLHVISASVTTAQTAACWVAITPDGRFVYTGNAGSGSVSGYSIHPDGSVQLLGSATAGSGVLDVAISADGDYLYAITRGLGAVHEFAIGADGSLTSFGQVSGLPTTSTTGIAAW